jgi:hypothetical protein
MPDSGLLVHHVSKKTFLHIGVYIQEVIRDVTAHRLFWF